MEDDNRKDEQASTSKKENKDRVSGHDEEYDDRERDDRTYSESSASVISSVRSRLEMRADGRPDIPKPPLGKRDKPERKKRVRRGRVSKRRRSAMKRYNHVRKMPRKKGSDKRERDPSVSTIFTRLSSRTGSESISCTYCGHRCCGRRLTVNERESKRQQRRTLVRRITKELRHMRRGFEKRKEKGKRKNAKQKGVQNKRIAKKSKNQMKKELKQKKAEKQRKKRYLNTDNRKTRGDKDENTIAPRNAAKSSEDKSGLEAIQIGSACKMLSPLFVKTNAVLEKVESQQEKGNYKEVTPEMICETLRRLQRWREHLKLDAILTDVKSRYPVNPNLQKLVVELEEKLRVAVIAGIVTVARFQNIDHWCLATAIQKRGLTRNHVTLFWQAFGDTLSPVRKKVKHAEDIL